MKYLVNFFITNIKQKCTNIHIFNKVIFMDGFKYLHNQK